MLPGFTTTDTLLLYDVPSNTWSNLGSAGTAGLGNYGGVSGFGSGDGAIELLITDGADSMGNSTTATHLFITFSGQFRAGPPMIGNRAGHAQGRLPDGRVLVADGFNTASTTVSTVEVLNGPPCPTPTPSCEMLNGLPCLTPTATATATPTLSPTGSPTATHTPPTPTVTATATHTPTATPTVTITVSPSPTPTPSETIPPVRTTPTPSDSAYSRAAPITIHEKETHCSIWFFQSVPSNLYGSCLRRSDIGPRRHHHGHQHTR